jgi:hypothetical protein
MQILVDLTRALRGLSRLFRFDSTYRDYFGTTVQSAWRSFFAMMLVAITVALTLPADISEAFPEATWSEFLTVIILIYIISWTAYPLIAHEICRRLSLLDAFPGFVTVYNWFQLIHFPLVVLSLIIVHAPSAELEFLNMAITYAIYFGYLFFIARSYFRIALLPAGIFVLADYLLSEALTGVAKLVLWY